MAEPVSPAPSNDDLNGGLQRILEQTDRLLWAAYAASVSGSFLAPISRIIFPKYRSGTIRVSEQEARCLFLLQLNGSPFLYSVETPTTGEYSFQENAVGQRSAATDVTVYTQQVVPFIAVEFKAHGFSLERESCLSLTKDIVKLLKEPVDGLWFHTLEAADNSNIHKLWTVMVRDLDLVGTEGRETLKSKKFIFHVCVLRQKFAFQTEVQIQPDRIGLEWLKNFPIPDYRVTRDRLVSAPPSPWLCFRQEVQG